MTLKATLNLLMLILVIGMLSSCKSSIPLASTNTTKTVTVTEIVHDTIIKVIEDKSSYKALLKCIEGKVVIVPETKTETPGENLTAPKVNIKDNEITVDCVALAHDMFLKWTEHYKQEVIETETKIPYPVERDLTFFQKLFIWSGKIFLLLLLILAVGWILKIKKLITL